MLKLTTTVSEDGTLTVCIAGNLTSDGCEAVDRILEDARMRGRHVTIDLGAVELVDRSSIEYLARLHRRRVAFIGVPPYVKRWIDQILNGS